MRAESSKIRLKEIAKRSPEKGGRGIASGRGCVLIFDSGVHNVGEGERIDTVPVDPDNLIPDEDLAICQHPFLGQPHHLDVLTWTATSV